MKNKITLIILNNNITSLRTDILRPRVPILRNAYCVGIHK